MEVIIIQNLGYILLAVLVFGGLVFVHELGHFLAARLFKVRVNEFALGMGPRLLKFKGKRTLYSLRLLPIGGFCAMDGEDGEGSEVTPLPEVECDNDDAAFYTKPSWQRIIILAAGAIFNLLVGFIVLVIFYMPMDAYATTTIDSFMDGFPQNVELQKGDEILKVNNYSILYNTNIGTFLDHDAGAPYDITVRRGGEVVTLKDVPLARRDYMVEVRYEDGSTGIEPMPKYGLVFKEVPMTFGDTLRLAALNSVDFVRLVWVSLGDLLSRKAGIGDMSGVIGIGAMIVETAKTSMPMLSLLVALITINLGVMNLMPVPALDGGRILFILIDNLIYLVSKRRINPKYEGAIHFAGFALMMVLIVVVSYNDFMRLIK